MRAEGMRHLAWASIVILGLAFSGCQTNDGIVLLDAMGKRKDVTAEEVAELSGSATTPYQLNVGDQLNVGFRVRDYREGEIPWDYRIEIGDSMEVRLSAEMGDRDAYLIDVGDLIGLSFLNNWSFNVTRTVRPDGYISVEHVGDVKVGGLSTDELDAKLTELYRQTGIIQGEPNITVTVEFSNPDRLESTSRDVVVRPDGKIRLPNFKNDVAIAGLTVDEACEAVSAEAARYFRNKPVTSIVVFPYINSALGGMGGTFTVRPDGRLSVPRVGEIQAAGYTAEEVHDMLVESSIGMVHNMVDVSVDVVNVTGSRIYVGGEVGVPGVYPLASTPTALQAVIMARGAAVTGRLSDVIVMRRNPEGKPYVFKTNLRLALQGHTENDIPLRAFDVVYVPMKPIAKADLFVDQYINQLVPFDNTMGVNAQYYMNTQDVKTESFNRNASFGVSVIPGAGVIVP